MLTEAQGHTEVGGFTVYDMVLITHLVEKLLKNGLVSGKELYYVASIRGKALAAARAVAGVDLDEIAQQKQEEQEKG